MPEELWLVLAQSIDCRATLAALSQVSKNFNRIFTPILYKRIWMDRCSYKTVETALQLPIENRLEFVEYLDLGSGIQRDALEFFGQFRDEDPGVKLRHLLQKLKNLRSLR